MTKFLKKLLIVASVIGIFFIVPAAGASILQGFQGGTGLGPTATSTCLGEFLQFSSTTPFLTYQCAPSGTGNGTVTGNGTSTYVVVWVNSSTVVGYSNLTYRSSTGQFSAPEVVTTNVSSTGDVTLAGNQVFVENASRTAEVFVANGLTGWVVLVPLNSSGTHIFDQNSDNYAAFDTSLLTDNRNFQFPDTSGILCVTTSCTGSSGVATTTPFTAHFFPVISSSLALTNSLMYQSTTGIGIGVTNPLAAFMVAQTSTVGLSTPIPLLALEGNTSGSPSFGTGIEEDYYVPQITISGTTTALMAGNIQVVPQGVYNGGGYGTNWYLNLTKNYFGSLPSLQQALQIDVTSNGNATVATNIGTGVNPATIDNLDIGFNWDASLDHIAAIDDRSSGNLAGQYAEMAYDYYLTDGVRQVLFGYTTCGTTNVQTSPTTFCTIHAKNAGTDNEIFRVVGTGQVGIMTTSPSSTLTVNGNFQLQSSSTVVTGVISGAIIGTGCDSATTTIDTTVTSSTAAFVTTPRNDPGTSVTNIYSFLSAPGVITTRVCGVGITPAATDYVVKIIK